MATWRIIQFFLGFVIGLTLVSGIAKEAAHAEAPQEQRILIRFEAGVSAADRDAQIAALQGRLVTWMPQIRVAEVVIPAPVTTGADHISAAAASASALAVMATENPAVRFAETDVTVTGAFTPTDPDFQRADRSYAPRLIQAETAWDTTLGDAGVVVAVVDTGVRSAHPEFAGRLRPGFDFVNDDADPDDDHGHGTHAAGIIAAAVDNGEGSTGLCPKCSLMPVKVLDANNAGSWSDVAQGILYAVDNGADIINLSLGSTRPSQTVAAAVDYALERNVLVVAAAGNLGSSVPFYPAALDGVLAVNATDDRDKLWLSSNYGPNVDLSAPGHIVFSTYFDLDNYLSGYAYMSGTSMAAPEVAAAAGLLLSVNPDLTPSDLTAILTSTAVDLGPPGRDNTFGAGRLDASLAVAAAVATVGSSGQDGEEKSAVDEEAGQPSVPTVTEPTTGHDSSSSVGTDGESADDEDTGDDSADDGTKDGTNGGTTETSPDTGEQEPMDGSENEQLIIYFPMVLNR